MKRLILLPALALALSACGHADPKPPVSVQPAAAVAPDLINGIQPDPVIAATLPEAVRKAGVLRFGNINIALPFGFAPVGSTKLTGVEIDLRDAVAKVLGVKVEQEIASFDAILPAVSSGKYDVGQGNFGVTEARKASYDFTTYYKDGFGFAAKAGSSVVVKDIVDLCGKKLGTGVGTSFIALLNDRKGVCGAAGKPDYSVTTFPDTASWLLGLDQGRIDLEVSTAIGLRYAEKENKGKIAFVGGLFEESVGFTTRKGSGLEVSLNKAVQKLIDDGTYGKILANWGLADAALPASQINPPGLR
jgi:polar amino acid transport system substrate-binding protein